MEKVTVRIRDDYTGHHHAGVEVPPGTTLEVWPDQAAFLHRIGAIDPPQSTKSKKSDARKASVPDASSETPTTEGGDATPEEPSSNGE